MLKVVLMAAEIEINVMFLEQRSPVVLEDSIVGCRSVAEQRMMPATDHPLGDSRLFKLIFQPAGLKVPFDVGQVGLIAVEHQHSHHRDQRASGKSSRYHRAGIFHRDCGLARAYAISILYLLTSSYS